jgi:predicted metal-binding membrane protein
MHGLDREQLMNETARALGHLAPGEARLAAFFARPKVIATLCIIVLAGLGWVYIGLLVAQAPDQLDRALAAALCLPSFGGAPVDVGWQLLLVFLMWCAMALAMMLPSAAPMIYTYAEIADTAARNGDRVVSPAVLGGGYAAVWLGFAAAAALLQLALTRAALLDPSLGAVGTLFSGAIFVGTGLYQFSALKQACVTQCQRPMPFFFANWSTETRGVFRLGLRQGLFCLGCCWAMMLVMFAVGLMNIAWMAALGLVMTVEKMATTTRFSRVVGVILLAIGAAFLVTALVSQWPARPS